MKAEGRAGVYREEGTSLVWHPTTHLRPREVGEVLEHAVRRMAGYLRRKRLLVGATTGTRTMTIRKDASRPAVSGRTPPAGPSWQRGLPPQRPSALGYDKPLCASPVDPAGEPRLRGAREPIARGLTS